MSNFFRRDARGLRAALIRPPREDVGRGLTHPRLEWDGGNFPQVRFLPGASPSEVRLGFAEE